MSQIPAFRGEPNMPPDLDVRPWLLVYYTHRGEAADPARYWKEYGSDLSDAARSTMKVTGEIRMAAQTATAGRTTLAGKIDALSRVC